MGKVKGIPKDVAYRYEDMLYTNGLKIVLHRYDVIKYTAKGFWIELFLNEKRFVLKDARKKYACLNKENALESFRARKRCQIRIVSCQLERAKEALFLSKRNDYGKS